MITIIFDSPPGPESQFVEVERDGKSIRFGEWKQRAPYWCLDLVEVDRLEKQLAASQAELAEAKKDCEVWWDKATDIKVLYDDNCVKLAASQAECERLREKGHFGIGHKP